MKNYEHIFFDLDHTLWDYETASAETLSELFEKYNIGRFPRVTLERFIKAFRYINQNAWHLYQQGKVEKDFIRHQRFERIFKQMGVAPKNTPQGIDDEYVFRCPQKPHLIKYTIELLNHLAPKYKLHILTNGFSDVQFIKLKSSGIHQYFDSVITADMVGKTKPHIHFFKFALEKSGANVNNVVMVGDNSDTDIKGASAAGIDSVFFNPYQTLIPKEAHLNVTCLSELIQKL